MIRLLRAAKWRENGESVPLRLFYSFESISTLCLSCAVACLLVCAGILLFRPAMSMGTAVLICVTVCAVAVVLGGYLMLRKARFLSEPIARVAEAADRVSQGDLSAKVTDGEIHSPVMELNRLNDSFDRMVEALKSVEYMNKDFMSNVAHELRTPIAAISGFTELLQDQTLPEAERAELLQLVHTESERLSKLTENMLAMSRLDHGDVQVRREKVNISEQIRRSAIILGERWEEKHLRLEVKVNRLEIFSDPDLTQQIWMNLLDNAMKYSEPGGAIRVCACRKGGRAEVVVRDCGVGIPREKLPHIYDRFYQGDESRKREGNGLGLSIVKRILELLGGQIVCESEEGKGTTMRVTLPENGADAEGET